jgi:hypothetical protein
MHATDETWRWRWRNDDRYFARYWGQAVRRLARGRLLRGAPALSTSRAEYRLGDPVVLRARLRSAATDVDDDRITAQLEAAGRTTSEASLSRDWRHADAFETTLRDLPVGEYTARLLMQNGAWPPVAARFAVTAPPGEMAQLAVNSAGLAEAARMTGGRFYDPTNWRRLIDELPPPRPIVVEQLPDQPWWNVHALLAVLCAALGAEWFLRRRAGLL